MESEWTLPLPLFGTGITMSSSTRTVALVFTVAFVLSCSGEEPQQPAASNAGGAGASATSATLQQVASVIEATRTVLETSIMGIETERVPTDPTARESSGYSAICSGGGSAQFEYETFDTETEIDRVNIGSPSTTAWKGAFSCRGRWPAQPWAVQTLSTT